MMEQCEDFGHSGVLTNASTGAGDGAHPTLATQLQLQTQEEPTDGILQLALAETRRVPSV